MQETSTATFVADHVMAISRSQDEILLGFSAPKGQQLSVRLTRTCENMLRQLLTELKAKEEHQ